jgi:hypothetical protein
MITEPINHQCERETCKAGFDAEIKEKHQRINLFLSRLNEPQRRWYVATVSEDMYGTSDRQLAIITGLDEKSIQHGKKELQERFRITVGASAAGRWSTIASRKKTHRWKRSYWSWLRPIRQAIR